MSPTLTTLKGIFTGIVIGILALCSPDAARALSLQVGTPVIAIDGDSDNNVSVRFSSVGGSLQFEYGYFLNDGSTFTGLPTIDSRYFQGGDKIDFALRDLQTNQFYSLSGDAADPSYAVAMVFGLPVTQGSPQQPSDWTDPYYYLLGMEWTIGKEDLYTGVMALDLSKCWNCVTNDGLAPFGSPVQVPEPTTLVLLGVGLLGLGLFRLNRPA